MEAAWWISNVRQRRCWQPLRSPPRLPKYRSNLLSRGQHRPCGPRLLPRAWLESHFWDRMAPGMARASWTLQSATAAPGGVPGSRGSPLEMGEGRGTRSWSGLRPLRMATSRCGKARAEQPGQSCHHTHPARSPRGFAAPRLARQQGARSARYAAEQRCPFKRETALGFVWNISATPNPLF